MQPQGAEPRAGRRSNDRRSSLRSAAAQKLPGWKESLLIQIRPENQPKPGVDPRIRAASIVPAFSTGPAIVPANKTSLPGDRNEPEPSRRCHPFFAVRKDNSGVPTGPRADSRAGTAGERRTAGERLNFPSILLSIYPPLRHIWVQVCPHAAACRGR